MASGVPRRPFLAQLGGTLALIATLLTVITGVIQVWDKWATAQASKTKPKAQLSEKRNSSARYETAKQLFYEHKMDAAIIATRSLVQDEPKNRDARKLLAACYGVQKNMEACAVEYREAVKLDRHDEEALLGLGAALEALGDKQGAKDAYSRVVGDLDVSPSHKEHARERLSRI